MNTQLINSLVQIINSLTPEEKELLEEKLFWDALEPTTKQVMKLAQKTSSFSFLDDEPDLYTLEDGELV